MPEELISESHGCVNVKRSAYYVIHKNETTARMVLVVYIGVTWLITLGGGGGKVVHRYWELQFTKKSSEKEGQDCLEPVLDIHTLLSPHSQTPPPKFFLFAPLKPCSQKTVPKGKKCIGCGGGGI